MLKSKPVPRAMIVVFMEASDGAGRVVKAPRLSGLHPQSGVQDRAILQSRGLEPPVQSGRLLPDDCKGRTVKAASFWKPAAMAIPTAMRWMNTWPTMRASKPGSRSLRHQTTKMRQSVEVETRTFRSKVFQRQPISPPDLADGTFASTCPRWVADFPIRSDDPQ